MIVTFDLTRHESFINVRDWINSVFKYKNQTLPLVLAGNKLDLCENSESGQNERQVPSEAAKELAKDFNGMKYIETSAKTDEGVQ